MTVTCPGPRVTQEPFGANWVLHVLTEKNTHTGNTALFKGRQTFDPARIQDNIPMSPAQALSNIPSSFLTPEAQQALKDAQAALDRNAAENSGKFVYTFVWELKPMTGTPPTP